MSLALASKQPYSEVLEWEDRDAATAWELIQQAQDGG